MTFNELKIFCDEEIKKYPDYNERYQKEIEKAKLAYENNINLVEELKKKQYSLSKRYVIPFLLALTNEVKMDLPVELKQAKPGDGGGLDIDTDFSSAGKEKIKTYLEEKYGKDRVISVGTYSSLGLASATKDILKREGVEFKDSNEFCSNFDSELTFDENMEKIKKDNIPAYQFYLAHKEALDYVPKILNKIRSVGRHAGGVLILPTPVYNHIPVERVQGELVSAFVESGAKTTLDSIGVVKLDLLATTVLDVIDNSIDMITEKIFLIEDDDGLEKMVLESYLTT